MITAALARAHQVRRDVVPEVSWRAMVASNNLDDWRRMIVRPLYSLRCVVLTPSKQATRVEYDQLPRKATPTYPPCNCEPPIELSDSEAGSDNDDTHSTQSDSEHTTDDADSDSESTVKTPPAAIPHQPTPSQSNAETTIEGETGDSSDSQSLVRVPYPPSLLRRLIQAAPCT